MTGSLDFCLLVRACLFVVPDFVANATLATILVRDRLVTIAWKRRRVNTLPTIVRILSIVGIILHQNIICFVLFSCPNCVAYQVSKEDGQWFKQSDAFIRGKTLLSTKVIRPLSSYKA